MKQRIVDLSITWGWGRCLDSIERAAASYNGKLEATVVLNRCTDRTKQVAESYNCVTITEDSKNLSKIRNAGVRSARAEIAVTIDTDSWMAWAETLPEKLPAKKRKGALMVDVQTEIIINCSQTHISSAPRRIVVWLATVRLHQCKSTTA